MSDFEKLVNKLEWAITGIATFGNEFWDRPQIPRSKAWEETRAALLSAIARLESERDELKEAAQWIPVDERLPEPGWVIAWNKLTKSSPACWHGAFWTTETGEVWENNLPTHWRPLPQPPEVTNE
jgi:hypothetical protein